MGHNPDHLPIFAILKILTIAPKNKDMLNCDHSKINQEQFNNELFNLWNLEMIHSARNDTRF